jgi:polar amino acid transport system substrate-binding protein
LAALPTARRVPPAVAVAALLALALPAVAQEKKPPLRWGGDANGGAPFIFESEAGKLSGFEVEFADYLAGELGRTPVFVQNQWDNVPELLKRPNLGRAEDIDVALNGYEYSPERHAESPTTVPYYVYTFRLIGRKADATVNSWHNVGTAEPRKRVGVLRGTAAQRYLESRYGDAIEIVPSETVTEMLGLVSEGRGVDCTVQDSPAAAYYVEAGRYPQLRVVDEPIGTGYYVILTRPGDDDLREKLNAAIRAAVRSGRLRDLYQKYGMWTAAQQRLLYLAEQPWPQVADEIKEEVEQRPPVELRFWNVAGHLVSAAGMTVLLAVASFPLAVLLGMAVATARVYGPWPVRALAVGYVEVLRGTPLLLQLFVIFYLLPQLGALTGWNWLTQVLSLPPLVAGILGLALNYSANEAENYRAGLLAVPRGQAEAALSLGLSRWATFRRVVLPQAFRIVLPPVTNDFIALFKDTAVCSTILIVELTGLYYKYKMYPGVVVELALAVGLLYLLMSYPLSLLAGWMERRMGKS